MDINTHIYRIFCPLSYLTLALCSGFFSHIISAKYPRKFNKIVLPIGILACKYAPGTSNVVTYFLIFTQIINVISSASSNTSGDEILYPPLKLCLWLIAFAHVLPFMGPYLFYLLYLPQPAPFLCQKSTVHMGWLLRWPSILERQLRLIV